MNMSNRQHSLIVKKTRNDLFSKLFIIAFSFTGIIALLFIFVFVLKEAIPSIQHIGFFQIFFRSNFSPSQGKFGVWGPLIITLFTSISAVLLATYISTRIAILIHFRLKRGRKLAKFLVELLASVPSIIFGLFASNSLGKIVEFLTGASSPNTIATAVVMLVFIVTPIMTSLILNQLIHVSREILSSSMALGNTKTYSIYHVVKKEIGPGIIVAAMVAFGRAIGETMAVSILLAGGVSNPFSGGVKAFLNGSWNTLGGNIAYWMTSDANNPFLMSALYAAGIMLFVIIMIINLVVLNISRKKNFTSKNYSFKFQKTFDNRLKMCVFKSWFVITYPLMLISWLLSNITKIFKIGIHQIKYFTSNMSVVLFNPKWSGKLSSQKYYYLQSHDKRKYFYDNVRLIFEIFFLALVIFILGWIFENIFSKGVGYFQWNHLFNNSKNSLGTSLMVTIVLILTTLCFAFPLALVTAIYLSEYAKQGKFPKILRFFLDSLGGTPSIIFGMFGLVFFLEILHMASGNLWKTGSLMAGSLTMVIVVLPSFTRVIEQSLTGVSRELRLGSLALGASKWETIKKIVLPSAMQGIVSGIILTIGRTLSETAPIYLTAGLLAHKLGLLFPGQTLTSRILYNALYSPLPPSMALNVAYEAAMATFVLVIIVASLATYSSSIKSMFWLLSKKIKNVFTTNNKIRGEI